MPIENFKGAWTALVTPFDEDAEIDYNGLEKNIEFQVKQGISGILPVGTTGESPTLSTDEHNDVVREANRFAGGRCGVLAGAGSNSTKEAISHCRHALESGVDKVLLVDCYYNGPSSLELRKEYYQKILDSLSDIKIIIYVIPGRTGTAILPVDIAILSEQYDRVIAIKEATGDLERMAEERSLMPDISIMSGDDDKTLDMMTRSDIGASGAISVVSNIAPRAVQEMITSILEGNIENAKIVARKLKPLFSIVTVKASSGRVLADGRKIDVVDRFRNPLAIKTAMIALGMPSGFPRGPLGKMNREGAQIVRNALKKVYNESPEVLQPIQDFYGTDIEKRLQDDRLWDSLTY